MKTTFTFIRHGQTDWNKLALIQGCSDVPLNETGLQQAITKAPFFANKTYTHAFSSPLIRAQVTLETILKLNDMDLPIQLDDRLKERHFGLIEGRTAEFIQQIRKYNIFTLGYEEDQLIETRLREFFQDTISALPQANIIVAAHSHTLKAAHRAIQPTLPLLSYSSPLDNLAVLIFEFDHSTQLWSIPYTEFK